MEPMRNLAFARLRKPTNRGRGGVGLTPFPGCVYQKKKPTMDNYTLALLNKLCGKKKVDKAIKELAENKDWKNVKPEASEANEDDPKPAKVTNKKT